MSETTQGFIKRAGRKGGLGSSYFMIGIMFYLMLWFYVID